MPVVTDPPILIDPVEFTRQSFQEINPWIFLKAGAASGPLYVVGLQANGTIAVFSSPVPPSVSADFIHLDSGNDPNPNNSSCSVWSGSGDIIAIAYNNNTQIVEFDTSTDTYGTPSAASGLGNTWATSKILYQKSGGDYGILYISGGNLNLIKLVGGVAGAWGAPAVVAAATYLFSAVIDSSDRVHIAYKNANRLRYVQIDASDTPGTSQDLLAGANIGRVDVVIQGDTLNWVFDNVTTAEFLTAAPLSAPVFASSVVLETVIAPTSITYGTIGIDDDSNLTALWTVTNFSSGPGVDEIRYSTRTAGVWSTAAMFYDAVTNPPPDDIGYPSQFIHTAQVLFSGGWLLGTAMETIEDAFQNCTGFILGAPAVSTISIACPIDGGPATVGVFYDSGPPVVTGGTEPFIFSLEGGGIPPGMTLDPDTGAVSGTTYVAGDYSYTIGVTDSSSPPLMAVVEEPCDIPVGGSSGNLPCDTITPQPETDVRFRLEKVIASLRETRHLPTRGSVK